MPYIATSQDFLKQSSLLLEAYPDTKITTRYSYPKCRRASTSHPPSALTPAALTLKAYHPESGICLKYRTTKAAEVSRLIAGLGRLAAGAPIADPAPAAAPAPTQGQPNADGDVEMIDAPVEAEYTVAAPVTEPPRSTAGKSNGGGGGGGGKKKKGGKGKR